MEIADARADVERRTILRFELRSLQRAAHALSPDQRLVLACQIGLQMSAEEFCLTFGWSQDKHRKVAQRARTRLRRLLDEPVAEEAHGIAARRAGASNEGASEEGTRGVARGVAEARRGAEKSFFDGCPVLPCPSE